MNRFGLFLLLFLFSVQASANTDSLIQVLNAEPDAKIKLQLLEVITNKLLSTEPQKAAEFASQMQTLAKQEQDDMAESHALHVLAVGQYFKGAYTEAIPLFEQSALIREKAGDGKGAGAGYTNIGLLYSNLGDTAKAYEFLFKSIDVKVAAKDTAGLGYSYFNLATIFQNSGRYEKALSFYNQTLIVMEQANDLRGMAFTHNNTGLLYKDLGNLSEAIKHFEQGLAINKQSGDKQGLAVSYQYLGTTLLKKQPEMADTYFKECLKEAKAADLGIEVCRCLNGLGDLALNRSDFTEAKNYYEEALLGADEHAELRAELLYSLAMVYVKTDKPEQARSTLLQAAEVAQKGALHPITAEVLLELAKIDLQFKNLNAALQKAEESFDFAQKAGLPERILLAAELLSKIQEQKGDLSKALYYEKICNNMQDSVYSSTNAQMLAGLRAAFDVEKQQQQIALLEEQKINQELRLKKQVAQRNAFMAGFGGLALCLFLGLRAYRLIRSEKKRSEDLLLNILPRQVAEELKATGASQARHYEMVSVLFTDFKGFTFLSEQLTPAELISEIDFCYKAFDDIIEQNNIEKIKTIGDAYMAAAGLPTPDTDNPERLIKAALQIRDFMAAYEKERKAANKPFFEIRIGIHSGPVVAGVVGNKKFAYDIWGDTVNIAARMESSGAIGKVNISAATRKAMTQFETSQSYQFEYRGKVEAKNKGEMDMYFVELSEAR